MEINLLLILVIIFSTLGLIIGLMAIMASMIRDAVEIAIQKTINKKYLNNEGSDR